MAVILKKRSPRELTFRNGWLPIQKKPLSPFSVCSRPGTASGFRAARSNIIMLWVSSNLAPTQMQALMPSPVAPGMEPLRPTMARFCGCRASIMS